MTFDLIPNLIIIICIVGILILFLRRLPEAVQAKGQLAIGESLPVPERSKTELLQQALEKVKEKFLFAVKKIWQFMLEAKDLQQSKILASQFTKLMPKSRKRYTSIGIYNSLKKAERQIEMGMAEAAEQTYFEIIRKYPHEYPAYEGLIKIYADQKNYDDIVEILEYLIVHNPENDSYLSKLGNTYLLMKRYPEAIEAYQKALEINDLISVRYANIGLAYKAMGKLEDAKVQFQKAVDLEPSNPQYVTMIVDTLEALGQKDQAILVLEPAIERIKKNTELKKRLEKLKA